MFFSTSGVVFYRWSAR